MFFISTPVVPKVGSGKVQRDGENKGTLESSSVAPEPKGLTKRTTGTGFPSACFPDLISLLNGLGQELYHHISNINTLDDLKVYCLHLDELQRDVSNRFLSLFFCSTY